MSTGNKSPIPASRERRPGHILNKELVWSRGENSIIHVTDSIIHQWDTLSKTAAYGEAVRRNYKILLRMRYTVLRRTARPSSPDSLHTVDTLFLLWGWWNVYWSRSTDEGTSLCTIVNMLLERFDQTSKQTLLMKGSRVPFTGPSPCRTLFSKAGPTLALCRPDETLVLCRTSVA